MEEPVDIAMAISPMEDPEEITIKEEVSVIVVDNQAEDAAEEDYFLNGDIEEDEEDRENLDVESAHGPKMTVSSVVLESPAFSIVTEEKHFRDKCGVQEEEIRRLEEELRNAREELGSMKGEMSTLKTQVAEGKGKIEAQRGKLKEAEKKVESLDKQNKNYLIVMRQERKDRSIAEKKLQEFKSFMDHVSGDFTELVGRLQSQFDTCCRDGIGETEDKEFQEKLEAVSLFVRGKFIEFERNEKTLKAEIEKLNKSLDELSKKQKESVVEKRKSIPAPVEVKPTPRLATRPVKYEPVAAPTPPPASNSKDTSKVPTPAHAEDTSKSLFGFVCVCGVSCSTKSNLSIHIRNQTQEGQFLCDICDTRFLYLSFLKKHKIDQHNIPDDGKREIGCRECGMAFPNLKEVHKHRKLRHTEGNSSVDAKPVTEKKPPVEDVAVRSPRHDNGVTVNTPKAVPKRHKSLPAGPTFTPAESEARKRGKAKAIVTKPDDTPNKVFKCNVCDERFQFFCHFSRHSAEKHNVPVDQAKQVGCSLCGMTFSNLAEVLKHRKLEHSTKIELPSRVPVVELKPLRLREKIKRPIKYEDAADDDDVSITEPSKPIKRQLTYPVRKSAPPVPTVQDEKFKFQCPICEERFMYRSFLGRHKLRKHNIQDDGDGKLGCSLCGKLFDTPTELHQHRILEHTSTTNSNTPSVPSKKGIKQTTKADDKESDDEDLIVIGTKERDHKRPARVSAPPVLKMMSSVALSFATSSSTSSPRVPRIPTPETSPSAVIDIEEDEIIHGVNTKKLEKGHYCLCGIKFMSERRLRKHLKNQAMPTLKPAAEPSLPPPSAPQPEQPVQSLSTNTPDPKSKPTTTPLITHIRSLPSDKNGSIKRRSTGQGNMTLKRKKPHGVDTENSHLGFYCICGSKYDTEKLLKSHVHYFSLDKNFPCSRCPLRCTSVFSLNTHLFKVHKVKNAKFQIGCRDCGITFESREEFRAHRKTVHIEGSSPGQKRNKTRQSRTTVHLKREVMPIKIEVSPKKRISFRTPKTRVIFSEPVVKLPSPEPEDLMADPVAIPIMLEIDSSDTEDEPISCKEEPSIPSAPVSATSTAGKASHQIDMSLGNGIYRCVCGLKFSNIRTLQTHVRYRTQKWNFQCHVCTKKFFFKSFLITHMKSKHNSQLNELPNKTKLGCGDCGKVFASRVKLGQHRRTFHKKTN